MPPPDEVEKITDSVGIVPQPNEEHDEPGDNAHGVVADLPEESTRVPRHIPRISVVSSNERRSAGIGRGPYPGNLMALVYPNKLI